MSKEQLLNEALNIIEQSSLSSDDKAMWQHQLAFTDENKLEMFIGTTKDREEVLKLATESLKKKIDAVSDEDKMNEVIKDEIETIKKLVDEN